MIQTACDDPYQARQYWTEVVRSAADKGKLEKVPTIKASSKWGHEVARRQNSWLTSKSFGDFGPNYDLIDWSR